MPLDCQYDLEDSQLYDVKWYKDGRQFFRCLPNGETMQYPVEGIQIYIERTPRTGSCPLTLIGLSTKTAGEFKCEVTAEGPTFGSDAKSTRFRVMEPAPRVQQNVNNKGSFGLLVYISICRFQVGTTVVFCFNKRLV